MPTYDYQCECGRRDDVLCKVNEIPTVKCECGKTMERVFSAPAIKTNNTFMQGHDYGYLDRNPQAAKQAIAKARQQGAATGHGNHYSTQLGQWYSSADDVRDECLRRGWGCTDGVEVKKAAAPETDGSYHAADDLVEEHLDREIDNEHGGRVSKKKRKQLKRELATTLAGNQH